MVTLSVFCVILQPKATECHSVPNYKKVMNERQGDHHENLTMGIVRSQRWASIRDNDDHP